MKVMIVDDERLSIASLESTIKAALGEETEIASYTNPEVALKAMEEYSPELVFLDIEMPGKSGLELADTIKKKSNDAHIVFVTAYSEYALPAWRLHVDDYLLKPASREDVLRTVSHITARTAQNISADKRLRLQCFGKFEVFYDGVPIVFKRSRAKEMLAYLVCAKGAGVTSGELCGVLWDNASDIQLKKTYLRQYTASLREALKECGMEDMLIHRRNSYSVDVNMVDCDYYNYLKGGELSGEDMFHGEFMTQYDWAEEFTGQLTAFP